MKIPNALPQALVDELLAVVYKYHETLFVPTVLGCLDLVKNQVLQNAMDEDAEE